MASLLVQFTYLQLLDLLSSMAFLRAGIQEANPAVQFLTQVSGSAVGGLVVAKAVAVALGVCCWRIGRHRLLARINIFYAALVAWNLVALLAGAGSV